MTDLTGESISLSELADIEPTVVEAKHAIDMTGTTLEASVEFGIDMKNPAGFRIADKETSSVATSLSELSGLAQHPVTSSIVEALGFMVEDETDGQERRIRASMLLDPDDINKRLKLLGVTDRSFVEFDGESFDGLTGIRHLAMGEFPLASRGVFAVHDRAIHVVHFAILPPKTQLLTQLHALSLNMKAGDLRKSELPELDTEEFIEKFDIISMYISSTIIDAAMYGDAKKADNELAGANRLLAYLLGTNPEAECSLDADSCTEWIGRLKEKAGQLFE